MNLDVKQILQSNERIGRITHYDTHVLYRQCCYPACNEKSSMAIQGIRDLFGRQTGKSVRSVMILDKRPGENMEFHCFNTKDEIHTYQWNCIDVYALTCYS